MLHFYSISYSILSYTCSILPCYVLVTSIFKELILNKFYEYVYTNLYEEYTIYVILIIAKYLIYLFFLVRMDWIRYDFVRFLLHPCLEEVFK